VEPPTRTIEDEDVRSCDGTCVLFLVLVESLMRMSWVCSDEEAVAVVDPT
jgi:hypothetical protein